MNFDGLYTIRAATAEDRNFVLKSFLLGIYYGDSWFSMIPKRIFMDNYKKVAALLFDSNTVRVACLPDDPTVIIGYSVFSHDLTTMHWVYVKEKWRKHGIAKALLANPKPEYVTHLTALGKTLLFKLNQEIVFNPFRI